MLPYPTLTEQNLRAKRVLIRVDMNVPLENGVIRDDTRIRASLPTIEYALEQGSAVLLMTHLGRPTEGQPSAADSVAPIAQRLSSYLKCPVRLIKNWRTGIDLQPKEVVLLENVRFNLGEKNNDTALGQAYAKLADIFVNDAFGSAHRKEASTYAVAQAAPIACAGLLLMRELQALSQALEKPARPLMAIVGGAKVSTKLSILETLADKVDQLIVGGGIANTFLLAAGYAIGQSLAEPDLVETARRISAKIRARGAEIPLPSEVVCATAVDSHAQAVVKSIEHIDAHDKILDVGPQFAAQLVQWTAQAGTIVWNGPLGVFELEPFSHGTQALAQAIAASPAFSLAGGGDTLAAIEQFAVTQQIDYISTGGGAFLEFLEGKTLPAVAILADRRQRTEDRGQKNITR